jgi:DNA polymerase III subunit epsilon
MRSNKNIFIDLETTGLDPLCHATIQIAGLVEIDGEVVEEFDIRMKPFPNQLISKESLKVNSVSIQDLKNRMSPKEGYKKFIEIISKYIDLKDWKDKFFFIGYNCNFDKEFLEAFLRNCADFNFQKYFWWPLIDVSVFAIEYFREEREKFPNFKLSTVAKSALSEKVDEEKLHEALYDSVLTRNLYRKFVLGYNE